MNSVCRIEGAIAVHRMLDLSYFRISSQAEQVNSSEVAPTFHVR